MAFWDENLVRNFNFLMKVSHVSEYETTHPECSRSIPGRLSAQSGGHELGS